MNNLLNDNVNTVEYAVMVDGKVLFKSSAKVLAENYRNNLPENDKAKASINPVTKDDKQILFG
ncbi:MAG: hypothetical protein JWP44_5024 [Mucilaginibacter sp.]|nr:hypothetical protein [Mucilaginibacter sp.]